MRRQLLALGLALAVSACGKDSTTPTSASDTSVTTVLSPANSATRLFTGTLTAGDSQFYSFTLTQDVGVLVTLASVTGADTRDAMTTPLGVGLGVPRGTECVMPTRTVAAAALTPQIREYAKQGVHCVGVYDPGRLAAPVRFAVRIGYFQ